MFKVKIVVQSYNESRDLFTLAAYGFKPEHQVEDPDYCKYAPDFDDFEVPGVVLPYLINEFGESSELLGRSFTVGLGT